MGMGTSVWVEEYESKKHGTRFYVRWRHNGEKGCKKAGGNEENADLIRNQIERKFLTGQPLDRQNENSKTVGQLFKEYIDWQESSNKINSKNFAYHACKYFSDKFKNKPVSSITKNHLKEFKADIYSLKGDDGELKWSHNGNLKRLRYVKTMMKTAIGDCITKDQFDEMFDKNDPKLKNKKPDPVARFLKDQELEDLLLKGCEFSPNGELADIVTFTIGSLMRRGEVLRLTKEMITRDHTIYIEKTKTDNPRIIVIPAELHYIVDRVESGIIFSGWTKDRLNRAFRRAVRRSIAGRLRFHDLRHTGIYRLIRMGWPEKQIMKMSGHKTSKAFEIYAHVDIHDIEERMKTVHHNFPRKAPELQVVGA